MNSRKVRIVVFIGFLAISGVLALQSYWLIKAFDAEQDRLDEDIHIALLEVVKQLYRDQPLPQNNPVKRISADYYAVNTEAEIDAQLLEYFLQLELSRRQVELDFEYAIYNCYDDEMVYGSYVPFEGPAHQQSDYFPRLDDYVYYFAVRFPGRTQFIASSLWEWMALTGLILLVLGVYVYSVFALLRQGRYSAMQRDFINALAHEFKTPLASIRLASAYLSEQPMILNDDRASGYATALLQSSDRLNAEVERILELAKVEARTMPIELSRVSLRDSAEEVIGGLMVNYPEVHFEMIELEGVSIKADPTHLKNVLYNLLENAAKHGGKSVLVYWSPDESFDELRVTDDGPGIPKEERKRVFGKFYRGSDEKKAAKGFGLGLYYVRHVVEAHKWQIDIGDTNGEGTVIKIRIPK